MYCKIINRCETSHTTSYYYYHHELVYNVIGYTVVSITQINAYTRTYIHNPHNNMIWEMYKVGCYM